MCGIRKLICLLGLSLLGLFTPHLQAAPMLNGIGAHQELGQEVFIGALYSESLSNDASSLLSSTQAMRMELKIVAPDGLTTRRFSRMWIEGMAVNNSAANLTAQADNMVKFDGLFKGRFQGNDHVVFSSVPGKGVDISVNGVVLGTIADNKFFSLLLSTWIGRVPLSSDYRDSLLKVGDVDNALRSRFDAIKPSSARIAEINTWTGADLAVASSSSKSSSSKASSSTPARELAAEISPTLPEPTLPTLAKPQIELPPVAAIATASSTAASSVAPAPAVVDDAEEEEGPALTAQSLLARQFYISDIIKKINSKTRYPARARERGLQGSVRIALAIDREGNVISMNFLESAPYEALNKEARDAINRAAPFPAMPAELAGSRFEVTVPIRFVIPGLPKK